MLQLLVTREVTLGKERIKIGTKMREDSKESENNEAKCQTSSQSWLLSASLALKRGDLIYNQLLGYTITQLLSSVYCTTQCYGIACCNVSYLFSFGFFFSFGNTSSMFPVVLVLSFHWNSLALKWLHALYRCCYIIVYFLVCVWVHKEKSVVKSGRWLLYMRTVFNAHSIFFLNLQFIVITLIPFYISIRKHIHFKIHYELLTHCLLASTVLLQYIALALEQTKPQIWRNLSIDSVSMITKEFNILQKIVQK